MISFAYMCLTVFQAFDVSMILMEAVKVAEEALVTQVLRLKLLIGTFVSSLVI